MPGAEALTRGRARARSCCEAKEGLALINGTQLMTAVGGLALAEAWRLARTADVAGALTLDALKGTDVAFDPRIHAARPHPGQAASARNLRKLLAGSPIRESHRDCGKVQDAYSLRCMPQVHGAVRDALAFVTRTVDDRDERRHRQPDGLRGHRRAALGRQLPRRAGGHRRRPAGHRGGGAGRHQRAPDGAAGEPGALRPARVPHRRRRAAIRAHDRARHRGGPRLREQGPRPSRERGLDPDLREQGGPRLDGRHRRAQGRARGGQHAAHPRRRGPRRLPGPGVPEAPRNLACPGRGLRARPPDACRPTTRTGCSLPRSRRWPLS